MKLITAPIRLLFRLVLLPIKLLLGTIGFTFRTGFKAGALPVKGGYRASRALGLKALVLFALGSAVGVVVGKKLAESQGDALAGPTFEPDLGPVGETVVTEDITVAETADGGAIVDDVVVTETIVEGPDGEIIDDVEVTETITEIPAEDPLEQLEDELEAEIDAEVAEAMGETPGERAGDAEEVGGADV